MSNIQSIKQDANFDISSKTIKHLGLVAGMYDELGIGKLIDQLIPQDINKRHISIGTAIKAMVLNGLGFTQRALYLTPFFFQDKPVKRLLGPNIEVSHLNDDTLGRALDEIYEYGTTPLYSQVAAQAMQQLGLLSPCGHLDSTSFHVDGKYNSNEDPDDGVVKITKGYSRDNKPKLNQVVLQLINERQAGIPLLMEVLNGNNSDQVSFRETIQTHISQLQSDFSLEYLVADSALYTEETLHNMNDFYWISRVPERIKQTHELIHAVAPDLMRDHEVEQTCSIGVNYGGVNQRWVIIYSPHAYQRALKSINKSFFTQSKVEHKAFEKLCRQDFACEADAIKALNKFGKTLKVSEIYQGSSQSLSHYLKKGRPSSNQTPDSYIWRIEGCLASSLDIYRKRIERKSCYILASNQLDDQNLSETNLIAHYKDQQKVERGFRFLKDPLFMASTLFLKSTKRVMALMMVMTICLMVYAAIEHRIRNALKEHQEVFPNQKGKLIQNPTARWVFQYFKGIHVLQGIDKQEFILNLNHHHLSLLSILGERYITLYSKIV